AARLSSPPPRLHCRGNPPPPCSPRPSAPSISLRQSRAFPPSPPRRVPYLLLPATNRLLWGRQTPDVTRLRRVVSPFDAHRNAHAAADTQRGQALFRVALLHLVEQRDQHAPARGADRMAERDPPAVDVDLRGVPAEVLVDGAGLRGERLVRFDQIEIADIPAGLLERGARRRDRSGAHDRRINTRVRPRHDAGERFLAALG